MNVLVINCGSSSLKFKLFEMPQQTVLAAGSANQIGDDASGLSIEMRGQTIPCDAHIPDHHTAIELILENLVGAADPIVQSLSEIGAVGHRVVHGGDAFTGSVLIHDDVLASIEKFSELAPLHNPPNLEGIRAARHHLPSVPQVACFDTAFHATLPPVAYTYALPSDLCQRYGIRRYGFHGTSHRWVARRAAAMLSREKHAIDCITCHLGSGCSLTAVERGRSIDTSMGFTPLEGLIMGTRSGDIDPAILFFLAQKGYTLESLNSLCNTESGLLGLSGLSGDVRILTDAAHRGDASARFAIDAFCYRIRKYIGSYTAILPNVDALVFTGGIGENSTALRTQITEGLGHLGMQIDKARNSAVVGREGEISAKESPVRILVIPTNEERAIAYDTYEIAHESK
jgi:acetate kinase